MNTVIVIPFSTECPHVCPLHAYINVSTLSEFQLVSYTLPAMPTCGLVAATGTHVLPVKYWCMDFP